MASLGQPDPSSPGAVAGASFPTARRGFDPVSVRDFLRLVSDELARAQHERDRLARELDDLRNAPRHTEPVELDEATVAAKLGEEAARVLATAHEASTQIRTRAEETSSRILREAEEDASRQRGDAEVEAARRRRETDEQCEAELEAAKAEGREMVAEARAVRERVFNDLTRRRELAVEQIETLHAGRRRILDSFRGAQRDLASILAELEEQLADDADDELPDLELPDTGPVTAVGSTASALAIGEMDVPAAIVARHREPEPQPAQGASSSPVDEVFARLRSGGAATVAREMNESDRESSNGSDANGAAADEDHADEETAGDTADDVDAGETTSATPSDDDGTPAAAPVIAIVDEPVEATAGAEQIVSRDAALGPIRTRLSRQLKRVLADEQNDVLDRLRQRNASTEPDRALGTPDEHAGTYREAAEDQLWAAAEAGAHSMSSLEGEELHAALEGRSVLDRCLDTVTSELVVPLRARLTESLEAAGDDTTEAAGLLRSTYREWKGRIDELSGDFTRTAYGRAAYAVLAPGTPVCWAVDASGPPCPDAEDNALAGAVRAGEPFPTGHRYAPAYRGCRCLLIAAPR
jgi:cell division septum initiation protein DivIVA